jgi:hypothetical protein
VSREMSGTSPASVVSMGASPGFVVLSGNNCAGGGGMGTGSGTLGASWEATVWRGWMAEVLKHDVGASRRLHQQCCCFPLFLGTTTYTM